MLDNPIQFAVVREDPLTEFAVLDRYPRQRLLLIASGGCTALSLLSQRPSLQITVLDPNLAQLDLLQRKIEALAISDRAERLRCFNVGDDDRSGLSECGNFESLFRGLRAFIFEFVLPQGAMLRLFTERGALAEATTQLFEHPYWPVAFDLFFSDPLLNTMFGPDATQHADPNSYPTYFQQLFERGLTQPEAMDNPFLHHVFLGHYLDRPNCLPPFLMQAAPYHPLEVHHGFIDESVDLVAFDLIGLSNIMDWMAPEMVEALMQKILRETRPDTVVMWRQLNNMRDIADLLKPEYCFDPTWERTLWERDRSLFYTSLHIGVRQYRT